MAETTTFELKHERSPQFRTITPDGFNFLTIVTPETNMIVLVATIDEMRIQSETFEAEVTEASVKQTGERKFNQTPSKIEEVALRLKPELAFRLTDLLIKNLPSFAPDSIDTLRDELEKLKAKNE